MEVGGAVCFEDYKILSQIIIVLLYLENNEIEQTVLETASLFLSLIKSINLIQ